MWAFPLADKNLELLVAQLLLKMGSLRFFPPQVEPEEMQGMEHLAELVLMEDMEAPQAAAQMETKMPETEAPQLLIFLTILLLANWHPVVVAELDITEAQMAQAERPMAALAVEQNTAMERTENCPVAVVVLDQTDGPAVPVPMAAFTCDSIGNEG